MNRRDFFKVSGSFIAGGLVGGLLIDLIKRPAHKPRPKTSGQVSGPLVIGERCVACGGCIATCPVNVLELPSQRLVVNEAGCIHCGNCVKVCPVAALELI